MLNRKVLYSVIFTLIPLFAVISMLYTLRSKDVSFAKFFTAFSKIQLTNTIEDLKNLNDDLSSISVALGNIADSTSFGEFIFESVDAIFVSLFSFVRSFKEISLVVVHFFIDSFKNIFQIINILFGL